MSTEYLSHDHDLAGPRPYVATSEPDFRRGLDPRLDFDEAYRAVQQRRRWVEHRYGAWASTSCPLVEGYSDFDYSGHPDYSWNDYEIVLPVRDRIRIPFLLAQYEAEHADHHFIRQRAFCPACRQREMFARLSLASWLMRNPGRTPAPDPSDTELDWDGPLPLPEESTTAKVYVDLDDLDDMPEPHWVIPSLIPEHAVGFISGFDQTYKTFAALHFSLCLAATHRPVLYIMGEGVEHSRKRIAAWLEHNDWADRDIVKANLVIRTSPVDLFDAGQDFHEMVAMAQERRFALVVVDTLARSVGVGNQDSASDMSLVTQRLDRLKRACDGTVLVVAHTGKDASKGIRGSTAIRGNGDFAITMTRHNGHAVRMSTKFEHGGKQKDGATDFEIHLTPKQVGPSMVLVDASKVEKSEPQRPFDNLPSRVLGVLYAAREQDSLTATQVLTGVKEDGTGKTASRTTVYEALRLLQDEGKVLSKKVGNTITAPTRYWVAPHVGEGPVST